MLQPASDLQHQQSETIREREVPLLQLSRELAKLVKQGSFSMQVTAAKSGVERELVRSVVWKRTCRALNTSPRARVVSLS